MTNPARKRTTNKMLRIGTWNITSYTKKDQEIEEYLEDHRIEICAISETKKKGKGSLNTGKYILLYSGVEKDRRAQGGVGLLIHNKYEGSIMDVKYVDEHMMLVEMKMENTTLNVISVYAPDITKSKEEKIKFYENLQDLLDTTTAGTKTIILGDFNARVGNFPIQGVKQRFNEDTINENGERLIEMCLMNSLRINNTYFDHRIQHKITFSDSRGRSSMIDFIITNREIHPKNILDVRTLSSADINSGHGLILGKLNIHIKKIRTKNSETVEKINIESFENEGTKTLYKNRLTEKLKKYNLEEDTDIETSWRIIRESVQQAAEEALGKRTVNKKKHEYKTP